MWPGASVSGWYFSHPQSQYFVVGRLGRDQVEDYADRKGWTLAEAERWLSPNLGVRPGGLTGPRRVRTVRARCNLRARSRTCARATRGGWADPTVVGSLTPLWTGAAAVRPGGENRRVSWSDAYRQGRRRRAPGHRARLHRAVGHTFYSPWHEHRRPDRAAAPT